MTLTGKSEEFRREQIYSFVLDRFLSGKDDCTIHEVAKGIKTSTKKVHDLMRAETRLGYTDCYREYHGTMSNFTGSQTRKIDGLTIHKSHLRDLLNDALDN